MTEDDLEQFLKELYENQELYLDSTRDYWGTQGATRVWFDGERINQEHIPYHELYLIPNEGTGSGIEGVDRKVNF